MLSKIATFLVAVLLLSATAAFAASAKEEGKDDATIVLSPAVFQSETAQPSWLPQFDGRDGLLDN